MYMYMYRAVYVALSDLKRQVSPPSSVPQGDDISRSLNTARR